MPLIIWGLLPLPHGDASLALTPPTIRIWPVAADLATRLAMFKTGVP